MGNTSKKINLFISYCHDDIDYSQVLIGELIKFVKNSKIFEWNIWDDTKIHVGTFWDEEIQNNIQECNVALLLVSAGFMASDYIKEKEFNEFKKRYEEKGILIFPILLRPCDFKKWGDLAKLQFFKPEGRKYGKPSITDFTYADLLNFTTTDGTLIQNSFRDRYHLDLSNKIEDSFKEFLNRTKPQTVEPTKLLETHIESENSLSDFPKPSSLFTGRTTEKEQFVSMINSSRIFAIDGLGGTGKTQFVSKCIEELIAEKDNIIWLNGSAQSSFDVFIQNAGYGNILKGETKTDLILFSSLKDVIEKDKRIIFWDNFNDYEDITFSKFLTFANYYLKNSTVILITKVEPIIEGITAMPILRLEGLNKDAVEYGKKLKSSNPQYASIEDTDIEKICIAVDGHPLAIEFSISLMSRGKTAEDLILHLPELSGIKKVEEFSKRLFLDIFNHHSTSDEERECFLKCSVLKGSFSEKEVKFLNDGKEVFHLIDGLIDKLLIKPRNSLFEIHPLVRSFSYEKLNNKKAVHYNAAKYFMTLRTNFLSPSLEEKIYYHLTLAEEWEVIAQSIENDGKKFLQQGQLNFLSDIISKLGSANIWRDIFYILQGDIAELKNNWSKALDYFDEASKSENSVIKAEGIIKGGEITFRKGELKQSLVLYEKAYEYADQQNLLKEKARALNDIGLVYTEFTNYDLSRQKLDEALTIRTNIDDAEGIATTLNNIGNIYLQQSKYIKALEYYTRSLNIAEKLGDRINLALYYTNISNALRGQKKLKEAYAANLKSLNIYEEIGNKSGIAANLNQMGVNYLSDNQNEKAHDKLKEALVISSEIDDRRNMATAYHNIGALHYRNKNYVEALLYLYKAFSYDREMGLKQDEDMAISWIRNIVTALGKNEFIRISEEILTTEKSISVNIKEFLNEPYSRVAKKNNRNDTIKVQYKEGSIIEAKFKKLEKDINNGDCFIID